MDPIDPLFDPNEDLLRHHNLLPLPSQLSMSIKKEEHPANEIDNARADIVCKNEHGEYYRMNRGIKMEPMDDLLLSHQNEDSMSDFNIDGFGIHESMEEENARMEMEEDEHDQMESSHDEVIRSAFDRSSNHVNLHDPEYPLDSPVKRMDNQTFRPANLGRKPKNMKLRKNQVVTIDGITVPNSMIRLTQQLANGQLDYSQALSFDGTEAELREKLITIIQAINFRGYSGSLADGIILVSVHDMTISEACQITKLHQSTLFSYFRILSIFIDFFNSQCSLDVHRTKRLHFPSEPLPPLPIPSGEMRNKGKRKTEEMEKKTLKLIKSESTGFLSDEETEWNGEAYDFVTKKMMKMHDNKDWKFDDNREDNADILPILIHGEVSSVSAMERLKSVIQYVVNDRHSEFNERLYIRPLLIHHFCNGFTLDYLFGLYKHHILLTQEQLQEYCSIITNIYKKTEDIIIELQTNHVKCDNFISTGEMEPVNLKKEMRKKFLFLHNPQWIPDRVEQLSEEQMEWRRDRCDVYMYYALIAITQLHELGYLLTDVLISEIVRITVNNIPSSVCQGLQARLWAIKYIKTIIDRNKARL